MTTPLVLTSRRGRVIGSVSVRHDPTDAIEETDFDEIILSGPAHTFATRWHQDLPHRLHHFRLPVTVVPRGGVETKVD